MRVRVACRTGPVLKMKWQDLVFSAAGARLMTFHAGYGDVRTGQREFRHLMFGDREERSVKIRHRVAALTAIPERLPGKLAVVGILVTIRAVREFDLIYCRFPGRNVAFPAFHPFMHPLQWIF